MKITGDLKELVLLDNIQTTEEGEPIVIKTDYDLQDGEKIAIHPKYCGTKIPQIYAHFDAFCEKQEEKQFQLFPIYGTTKLIYIVPTGTKLIVLPKILIKK